MGGGSGRDEPQKGAPESFNLALGQRSSLLTSLGKLLQDLPPGCRVHLTTGGCCQSLNEFRRQRSMTFYHNCHYLAGGMGKDQHILVRLNTICTICPNDS